MIKVFDPFVEIEGPPQLRKYRIRWGLSVQFLLCISCPSHHRKQVQLAMTAHHVLPNAQFSG